MQYNIQYFSDVFLMVELYYRQVFLEEWLNTISIFGRIFVYILSEYTFL